MQRRHIALCGFLAFSFFNPWRVEAGKSTNLLKEVPQEQKRQSHHAIQQGGQIGLLGIQPPTLQSIAKST